MSNPKQKTCFVIRPFDTVYDGQHNNKERYDKIFKPAIESAGFYSPHVGGPDDGLSELAKENIRNAHICFADVSENNAYVWYEVGFAFACNKQVVIVCNADANYRSTLYFGVRPKDVIVYKKSIDSNSQDAAQLQEKITERVRELSNINSSPVPQLLGNISVIPEDLTREDLGLLFKIMGCCLRNGYSYFSILDDEGERNIKLSVATSVLNLTANGCIVEGRFPTPSAGTLGYKCTDKAMTLLQNNWGLLFNTFFSPSINL